MVDFVTNLLGPFFTVAFVLLIVRAFLGIKGKVIEGPECKACGYNRTGLPNASPCPECGAEQKYTGSVLHIRKRRTARNPKRITLDLIMIAGLIALAYGSIKLDDYRLNVYNDFLQVVDAGDLTEIEGYLDRYPELARGRFRYNNDVNDPGGPMLRAARSGSPDTKKIILRLLDQETGPSPDRYVDTLRYAMDRNDTALVKTLFESGLDLTPGKDESLTGLLPHAASRRGCDPTIVELMLNNGADPNRFHDKPALTEAIYRPKKMHLMSMLLDAGADPNMVDKDGYTPIFIAVEHGRVNAVQLLIDAGADINFIYGEQLTPLDLAYRYVERGSYRGQNHAAVAQLLHAHGGLKASEIDTQTETDP